MLPKYKIIDYDTYPRKGQYELFSKYINPYAGITSNVDITSFYDSIHKKGYPFFISLLYCMIKAVNAVPQLRQRVLNGSIIEFEHTDASYILAKPDGTYCYCASFYTDDIEQFISGCRKREAEALACTDGGLSDPDDVLSRIYVSATPWYSFTQCHQPTPYPADHNPRIVFGKYFRQDGLLLLPVDILVNHSLAEGIHIARFFEAFSKELGSV